MVPGALPDQRAWVGNSTSSLKMSGQEGTVTRETVGKDVMIALSSENSTFKLFSQTWGNAGGYFKLWTDGRVNNRSKIYVVIIIINGRSTLFFSLSCLFAYFNTILVAVFKA